jgi:inositol phosphorylceramide mannosyltransferase catalytic subunit
MIYNKETFDQLIRKSDCFDEKLYLKDPRWKQLEYLYNNNYIRFTTNVIRYPLIPKIIHHIWLGGELPEKYKNYIKSWKKYNPAWIHRLWTDKDIPDLKLKNIDKFNQTKNFGQKSDILRYEILYKYGGIYVDTDFECLKPFDDLMSLKFFTGIAYPSDVEMYFGLVASIPEHPIMKYCIENMGIINDRDANQVLTTTGNYHFTKQFFNNKQTDGVVAFPMDFFYPFPNTNRDTIIGKARDKYIKECSYAIHHWGVSWV